MASKTSEVRNHGSDSQLQNTDLRSSATELENSFIYEMLKAAGLGHSRSELSGGAGEEHFSSMLLTEQVKAIERAGGLGLAQTLYENLIKR